MREFGFDVERHIVAHTKGRSGRRQAEHQFELRAFESAVCGKAQACADGIVGIFVVATVEFRLERNRLQRFLVTRDLW